MLLRRTAIRVGAHDTMMASHIAGRARVRKLGASSGRQHFDDGFQC
jgi:hypothetical protein